MSLSLKNLDRICLLTVLVVSGLCGFWIMKQNAKQKTRIRQEKSLFAGGLKNMNLAESNLRQLKTGVAAVKSELKALQERFPEEAEIGKFLEQLDSLIKLRKIALITLLPQPAIKERFFTKIPVRLMFKGAFNDIYYLLHDLETMKHMVVLERMTISKVGLDEQCLVNLTLNIFER